MHVALGLLSVKDGRTEEGREHFERALRISTNTLETLYSIVNTCDQQGFTSTVGSYASDLAALATSAVATDPGEPTLYEYRAVAYGVLGDEGKAERDRATARSLKDWWDDVQMEGGLEPGL